jgi:hypothetical protein
MVTSPGAASAAPTGRRVTDEIALNPSHFHARTTEQSLSTLVHEMAHLEQHHFGTPSRAGYHNAQWARRMEAMGLIPSDTGTPGGRKVGQKMSHYIQEDGPFARVCAELIARGFDPLYVERWSEGAAVTRKKKAASKTRYTCPTCGLNAWAKPDVGGPVATEPKVRFSHRHRGQSSDRAMSSARLSAFTRRGRASGQSVSARLWEL